jgi:hypothetical protein
MVITFDEYTHELTDFEMSCVKPIIGAFVNNPNYHGAKKAIKASKIISKFNASVETNEKLKAKLAIGRGGKIPLLSAARLGKIINYIRANRLAFIAATSDGYFLAVTDEEKLNCVKSMYQRIMGMLYAIDGMETMNNFKGRDENFFEFSKKLGKFCDRPYLTK